MGQLPLAGCDCMVHTGRRPQPQGSYNTRHLGNRATPALHRRHLALGHAMRGLRYTAVCQTVYNSGLSFSWLLSCVCTIEYAWKLCLLSLCGFQGLHPPSYLVKPNFPYENRFCYASLAGLKSEAILLPQSL